MVESAKLRNSEFIIIHGVRTVSLLFSTSALYATFLPIPYS